jgi:hypothetical protein
VTGSYKGLSPDDELTRVVKCTYADGSIEYEVQAWKPNWLVGNAPIGLWEPIRIAETLELAVDWAASAVHETALLWPAAKTISKVFTGRGAKQDEQETTINQT